VESYEHYSMLRANPETLVRLIPAIEIVLATRDITNLDFEAGFQRCKPKIKPIVSGPGYSTVKNN
jgi:hypothetical protein